MKSGFNVEFEYRPVGQGLFYTGEFRNINSPSVFRMVYDCGVSRTSSKKYIIDEVNNFGNKFGKNKLDLLIISHFHEDHYSNIVDLLKLTNGAKTVILPFLTIDEILLVYIQYLINGASPTVLSFIANPTAFLKDNNVDEIIYIHPSDDLDDTPPVEGNTDQDIKEDFQFNLINSLMNLDDLPDGISNEAGVEHCKNTGCLNLNYIWEFKFFNKVNSQKSIVSFKTAVNHLLMKKSASLDDITYYFMRNSSLAVTQFASLYKKHFSLNHINDTSLILFHAPINNSFNFVSSIILGRPYFPYRCKSSMKSAVRCGNLLTGDIKMDDNCLDQIINKWSTNIREDVVYFQIPHHGAEKYFISRSFDVFPRASQFIINFGLGDKNFHPRKNIIDMITTRFSAARIQLNTQINHVKIKFNLKN